MRRRSIFSIREEDNDFVTDTPTKKKKRKIRKLTFIGVTAISALCILLFLLDRFNRGNIKIHYDNDVAVLVKEFDVSDSIATQYILYRDWKDYSERWERCIDVTNELSYSNNELHITSYPVRTVSSTMVKYSFHAGDLINAQMQHMHVTGRGNFTLPTLYMKHGCAVLSEKWATLCMCSLQLDSSINSADHEVRKQFGDTMHMFNVHLDDNFLTNSDYGKAKLTISMIGTLHEIWMYIPQHLNVTFLLYNNERLTEENVLLRDPVNIINLFNCANLAEVKLSKAWLVKKP